MFSERTRLRLYDIVENADRIAAYLEGYDAARFKVDLRTSDAVERCLEGITEALIQMGADEVRAIEPNLPFAEIKGLGNKLRHEYRRIEPSVIFATARDDIPPLRDAAARALHANA